MVHASKFNFIQLFEHLIQIHDNMIEKIRSYRPANNNSSGLAPFVLEKIIYEEGFEHNCSIIESNNLIFKIGENI